LDKLTKEQEEVLDDVLATVVAVFAARLNIKPNDINFEDEVKTLFDRNIFRFGHALIDIHDEYDLEVMYEPTKEFEIFTTVLDVVDYISSILFQKRGLV
jgi:hypothetical protein